MRFSGKWKLIAGNSDFYSIMASEQQGWVRAMVKSEKSQTNSTSMETIIFGKSDTAGS